MLYGMLFCSAPLSRFVRSDIHYKLHTVIMIVIVNKRKLCIWRSAGALRQPAWRMLRAKRAGITRRHSTDRITAPQWVIVWLMLYILTVSFKLIACSCYDVLYVCWLALFIIIIMIIHHLYSAMGSYWDTERSFKRGRLSLTLSVFERAI